MKLNAIVPSLFLTAAGVEEANDAIARIDVQTLILAIIASGVITTTVSWFLSRRTQRANINKTEAEENKLEAEADNIVAQTYNQILEDLRNEILREQQECARRMAQFEEDYKLHIGALTARVGYLERREGQAVEHIQNLESKLRELGVPLPPTPWTPRTRREDGTGPEPTDPGDVSG